MLCFRLTSPSPNKFFHLFPHSVALRELDVILILAVFDIEGTEGRGVEK